MVLAIRESVGALQGFGERLLSERHTSAFLPCFGKALPRVILNTEQCYSWPVGRKRGVRTFGERPNMLFMLLDMNNSRFMSCYWA